MVDLERHGWFRDDRSELHCSFCGHPGRGWYLYNHKVFKRILCNDCLRCILPMIDEAIKEAWQQGYRTACLNHKFLTKEFLKNAFK